MMYSCMFLLLNYVFDHLMLQVRNFHILFCLSHRVCFILTPFTSFFRLGVSSLSLLLFRIMVESFELVIIVGCNILDNSLNKVLLTLFLLHIWLSIFEFSNVLYLWGYIYDDIWCWLSRKRHVVYDIYKLCFYIGDTTLFFKRNFAKILVGFSTFKKL